MTGYRIAQVKVIFKLPKAVQALLRTRRRKCPEYLAYVEWFTNFERRRQTGHNFFEVRRQVQGQDRLAAVIPLANIRRSVALMPKFGRKKPADWTSGNVLDKCPSFYVNNYSDRHAYYTVV